MTQLRHQKGTVPLLLRSCPPEVLEGERVWLKKHSLELAEAMFQAVDRDRERLRAFLPWVDLTRKLKDEVEYIQMTLEQWESRDLFDFGIFRKEDGAYLGNIGVHSISWEHQRCELGYWIFGAYEGKGYVSESVRVLERALFGLGFHRIEIRCSSGNEKSSEVPRACGYRQEGLLRHDCVESGERRDTLIFAKLATDPRG